MPVILGNEAAGVVEALGEGVSDIAVGDRVGYCGVGAGFLCQDRRLCAGAQRARRTAGETAGRHLGSSRRRP